MKKRTTLGWPIRPLAVLLSTALGLAGCASDDGSTRQEGLAAVQSRFQPQSSAAEPLSEVPTSGSTSSAPYPARYGYGPLGWRREGPSVTPEQSTDASLTLNFVDADIGAVIKSVLGSMLHLNYVVDATVSGTLTLRSDHPVTRAEAISLLEQALETNGYGLIVSHDTYRVVPLANASHESDGRLLTPRQSAIAGYGTALIPLKYISAADIIKLLGPLVPQNAQIQSDETRNALVVTGTSEERAAIADNVALLDVDYMAGMSFAIVPVNQATASTVVSELQNVVAPKGGPLDGLVRFVALDRMHSVLVISQQARYVAEAREWISRLDQAESGDEQRIFVYEVQNGRAKDLSAALSRILNADTGKTGSPGAELPSQSSDASGSAGGNPPGGLSLSSSSPLSGDLSASDANHAPGEGGSPRISADEVNNAVLFYGTATQYRSVQQSLRQLDVPPLQVMLEAVIAEVTLTKQLNFGVQYSYQDSHNQLVNTAGAAAIVPTVPGLAYTFEVGQNIKVILNALSSITKVDVISAPKVLVLNNQVAKLDVGQDVPLTTQTAQSTVSSGAPIVNSIDYRETGVILQITPRVNESGQVQMDISQEVSDVSPTTSSTLNSPTFDESKISSSVSVQDGETVALGGLIKDTRSNGTSGIPYLQNIPVLGALFSTKSNGLNRTELLVLVTPHVIQSVERLRTVTAELRQHMGQVEALLQR